MADTRDPRAAALEAHRRARQRARRRARLLAVAAGLLALALVGGVTAFGLVVSNVEAPVPTDAPTPMVTLLDDDAEAEPEPELPDEPTDERRADLELDPARETAWRYESDGQKVVYLTFDDGPSENTAKVLDVLDQYGAKATFFVTGSGAAYRSSIKDAYERGHTIGMHTFTHDYAQVYASEEAYFNDLAQVAEVVREQIGYVPFAVRFPGGASNSVSANYCAGIMTMLSQDVPARGYQYYDWNVSSGDAAGANVPVENIVANACKEGYTNIMLLFHDSSTKATTVEALPQIIQFYLDRGYVFKAITRDSFVCHHGVSN